MPDYPILLALITLTGIGISALVTWSIAQRRIAIEHVTRERSKWRKKVSTLALRIHNTILGPERESLPALRAEFAMLLNPADQADRDILGSIPVNPSDESAQQTAEEFTERTRLLLKHDWERAKLEAAWFVPRWILVARRHELECDIQTGCKCRKVTDRTWSYDLDKRVNRARLLAAIPLMTLIIAIAGVYWLFACHR